jgi:hypothetical protein
MTTLSRVIGVMTVRSAAYREIVSSAILRRDSALLTIFLAVASSLIYTLVNGPTSQSVQRLVNPLFAWGLFGYLGSFLIRILYKADVPAVRMLNVFGYAQVPGALAGFGAFLGLMHGKVFGSIVAGILISTVLLILIWVTIIAEIIGIREAGHLTVLQAIIIGALYYLASTLILSAIDALIGHI